MLKLKMKGWMNVLFAIAFLAMAGASQAQYLGPGEMKPATTVAEILKNPIDGQKVILKGKITKKFGKKHYQFADSTGKIRTEINQDLFFNNPVTDNTPVEIYGEVLKYIVESPEVEVFTIKVLTPK